MINMRVEMQWKLHDTNNNLQRSLRVCVCYNTAITVSTQCVHGAESNNKNDHVRHWVIVHILSTAAANRVICFPISLLISSFDALGWSFIHFDMLRIVWLRNASISLSPLKRW